ncbi:tRNA lysidine(34) synthetase TilS [Alkalilimnicola ehrlichii]|uniref:tRNA lysidine(34) synthetase TilS n=1 Tax=Alkalilimnicola ehrlichii TaxID=351052 RepID=UPI003BA21AF2
MAPTPELSPETLARHLAVLGPASGFCVAYSGGLDSTVLLHLMAALSEARELPLRAVHIHHGLQPQADAWAEHCRQQAAALGVDCPVLPVEVRRDSGEGLEAAARRARYAALASHLQSGEALLTAHHADDQAETVLLHLLRGSGPRGLAGMRAQRPLGRGRLLRPLLPWSRERLRAYGDTHALCWVEDPSNAHAAHDRNWLRHTLWPVLTERWPDASRRLGRAAGEQAEAETLLRELAGEDLARHSPGPGLAVSVLARLSPARARNLVRHWLLMAGLRPPPRARLEQGLADLIRAGRDRQPVLTWPEGELRRYRDRIHRLPAGGLPPWPGPDREWDLRVPLVVPGVGVLRLVRADEGIVPSLIGAEGLSVGRRRRGERCQLAHDPGHRPLSKRFQEAGIPPWERDRIPILRRGEEVVAIANLGTAKRFTARPGYRLICEEHGPDGG